MLKLLSKLSVLSSLLIALTGFASIAYAQKLPLLGETLTGGKEEVELPQPRPTNLDIGWWHYFDVEQDKLKARAESVQTDLQQLISTLPDGVVESSRSFIRLIQANLTALPEARAQLSKEPPAPPAYVDKYTVAFFLQLSQQLRERKETLQSETFEYKATEKTVDVVTRRNDTQFAAYLSLSISDPQRTPQGLEIMAERLSLLVTEENLRLQKANISVLEIEIKQLENEIAVAEQRLTASPDQLATFSGAIAQVQVELDEKHSALVSEQAAASSVIGNNEKNKISKSYRRQRVIKASIEEAITKIQLFKLQAERQVTLLLMNSDAQNVNPARTQLIQWSEELQGIEEQITDWKNYSERERQRSGRAINSTGSSEPPDETSSVSESIIQQSSFDAAQETLLAIERLQDEISQARLVIRLLDSQVLQKQGLVKDSLARGEQFFKKLAHYATDWISVSLFTVGDTPVTALGLLRIALILTIAWWISHWLRRALGQLGQRGDGSNLPAFYTVGRLSHYVIIILGFLIGLSSIGMDFTNFALVAGALAIGIVLVYKPSSIILFPV